MGEWMDAGHIDALARALTERGIRRRLLSLLATLPLLGGLFALLDRDEVDAKGRRKRRKKAHKHGKGRHKGKRKEQKCKPHAKTKTCSGTCGPVKNNCKKTVDCGSCDCPEPCDPCFLCQAGPNTPGACMVDPDMIGEPCGSDGQVCHDDGACACDDNSCGACRTCEEDGACQGCTGCCDGETCVSDCGDCQICDEGACVGCPDCCDDDGVCQDGESNAACGRSGVCDECTGQEECQDQQCVCIPDCDGKECGPDGCGDACGPGCAACETCLGDGTCSAPCGGSGCCAGETCEEGDRDTACGRNGQTCQVCSGPGVTCGGGGQDGVCGCTPLTTCSGGRNCGTISDGCGGMISCGACTGFDTCGGGTPSQPNVCGCTAKTCAQLGKNCGTVGDGCGGTIDCGTCNGASPICADNVCTTCSSSAQCQTAGLGNLCCGGQCLNGACCDNADCSGTTPICTASHTCVACTADSECGANALCLDDGSCQACSVTCTGTPAECGAALQTAINGRGTVYVCPGTYQGPFFITEGVTVIGAGDGANAASNTILSGNHEARVVETTIHDGSVDLQRLRITGGRVRDRTGGGIFHRCNFLRMTDCTITGNTVENENGGGIANSNGRTMHLTRCTLSDNHATGGGPFNGRGGAIYALGPVTLTDCIFELNSASVGGGGIHVNDRTTTLAGETIVRNNRSNELGTSGGGGIDSSFGIVVIAETCRVTGNTAPAGNGGGIRNISGLITLQGSANPSPIVTNNCHENCTGNVPNCASGGSCPP
jgi:hypothetical protein